MRARVGAYAILIMCFSRVLGQEVEITSLHSGGALAWTAPSGSVYTIEWCDSLVPAPNWKRGWNALSGILITQTNASAAVPMFYRVVCNTSPPVMTTPYVAESDMKWVRQGYSAITNCPWGFEHDGVDFQPVADTAPFQAVFDGRITELCLRKNPPVDGQSGNWDVYVVLTHDDTWHATYNFEPKTTNLIDGLAQLTNMTVSLLQEVSQGELIGRLYQAAESAHVHFSVVKKGYKYFEGEVVSPKPFFAPTASLSVMRLVTNRFPNASDFCYP